MHRPRPTLPRAGPPPLTRLTAVRNARDLADACPRLPPGRVLRSACPAGAPEADVRLLRRTLGVAALLDLRSDEERAKDPRCLLLHAADADATTFDRDDPLPADAPAPPAPGEARLAVRHVSLLDRKRFYRALLKSLPKRTALKVLTLNLLSPPRAKRAAMAAINAGGLPSMYACMLDSSAPEFAAAARCLLQAASARLPLLFFCRVGKDRTGLFAALVLSLLGGCDESIAADYCLSDGTTPAIALGGMEAAGRELAGLDAAAFARAPEGAIRGALDHVRRVHGGVPSYLASGGFSRADQAALVAALTVPAVEGGCGGYGVGEGGGSKL